MSFNQSKGVVSVVSVRYMICMMNDDSDESDDAGEFDDDIIIVDVDVVAKSN